MGFKHYKFQPNEYVLVMKNGKVIKQGNGLSFFCNTLNTGMSVVPTVSFDTFFAFDDVLTSDFQRINIQGDISYIIRDYEKVAGMIDFSYTSESGYEPVLLPEKEWFDVDVISCAAPNLRCMSQHDKQWKKNVTDQELLDIYKKRINCVLDIARYAKSEVVILGAFGCGAFANPPELVAKAMHASIDEHKYDFETIELAVYCPLRDTSNYEVFAKEFSA